MIGILHHSPVTVSILLDRERFKPEFISESDVTAGIWEDKMADFIRSSRDNRTRVLFVEKLSALQAMLADGLDTNGIKVALYDDCDVLKAVPGVDLVDAGLEGAVWKTYQLLPERLNEALETTASGVPAETFEFDPSSAVDPLPQAIRPPPPALSEDETDSVTQEMRQADAILRGALADESPQMPPEPLSEDDGDEDLDDLQGESEEALDESEEPDETAPDPVPDPPPPPEPKVVKKKTKKKTKKKKKLTSRKLF